jgi:hypothetical protein
MMISGPGSAPAGAAGFGVGEEGCFVFTTTTSRPSGVLYMLDANGPFSTSIDSMLLRGMSPNVFLSHSTEPEVTTPSTMTMGSFAFVGAADAVA